MDNFTHSLAGWALGQTGLKMKSRKGLAALILGANLPDIDVFFGWVPWEPLATHRGFTHGLVGGIVLLPALLAALLWCVDRWQCARGVTFRSGLPFHLPWLILLCYLGALTHPLLDLQTTYAVQLLSPFSTIWFHTDTLFIIDAVIWTVLPFAIWLSRRRERHGGAWRRPAIIGLLAVCAYIGCNGIISLAARRALMAHIGQRPEAVYAGEEPVLFWRRNLVWRQDGMIGQARYDPLTSLHAISHVQPLRRDLMQEPLVRQAIAVTPSLRPFLRWSTMPIVTIERQGCRASVSFADARFLPPPGQAGGLRRAGPFAQAPVILPLRGPFCP
ncbi:MAG: metal-dependent hydrolase [Sphingobium sp.]